MGVQHPFRRKKFISLLCLFLLPFLVHARPADTEESRNASPFKRYLSGVQMAFEMISTLIAPTLPRGEEVTPTKMQVYFVGLGRTGTTSIAAAMNILGYSVLHHDDEGLLVTDLYGEYYKGKMDQEELLNKLGERGFNCSFMYTDYKWVSHACNDVESMISSLTHESTGCKG